MAAGCEDCERRARHRWNLLYFSAYEEIHVFHQVPGQLPGTAKGGRVSNDAVWVRGVTGIQLHHTTDLQDAGRFLGDEAVHAHFDLVIQALAEKLPRSPSTSRKLRPDVLAFTVFPRIVASDDS